MRIGPHEALKQIAGGDGAGGLEALVNALREFESRESGSGIDSLCHLLDAYPELRAALRALLRELLGESSAAMLYAEAGILANTGFFTELTRRLIGRLLPAPRDLTLRGQFGAIFESGNDADWLEKISADNRIRIVKALRLEDDSPDQWLPAWNALIDAIDLLSVRIAAIGVEPELQRHYHVPRSHNNPFLAQNALIQDWLANMRGERTDAADTPSDTAQAEVLLTQCRGVMERIHRSARSGGASLNLTFLLRRLQQSLCRMETLLLIAAQRKAGTSPAAETRAGRPNENAVTPVDNLASRLAFGIELALAEGNDHNIGEHFRASTELVAKLTTESASRTGEHYITETRSEYLAMFRSALGAGGIIGLMALLKMGISSLHLPPFIEAFLFGLNYAAGFVLIYVLHFTIATKQPAMTAQTLASHLSGSNRRADTDAIGLMVSRVARTQFIAIAGNVLLAIPIALSATALLVFFSDAQTPAAKAPYLVQELHPFTSPALFHAAIAGVWLFVAGLINGFIDNLATYERLADRVRRMHWLLRFISSERRERFAIWLEDNIGGITGNVFFGFALGMTGFFGSILGLPLDIRHITFAAANLSIAVVGENYALPAATILMAGLGVLLIGVMNLLVSFSLALWVALRARGQAIHNTPALVRAITRRFRMAPLAFLWPPRVEAPVPTTNTGNGKKR